jgi:NAD+-dependent farnesol dehydrogenase
MTTFITGATSDLGRVLVRELVRHGIAMRLLIQPDSNRAGLELPGVEFVRGELSDVVTVRKGMAGCDSVFHLAEMGKLPDDSGLLQAAHDMRIPSVVIVSDLTLLGPTQGPDPVDETQLAAGPPLIQEFLAKGLAVKLAYPGVGYGCVRAPGRGGLAEHTLLRLAANQSMTIPGRGRNPLAVSYFKDTVQGILLTNTRGQAGQSYILTGEAVTWPELLQAAAEIVGQTPPQRRTPLWWMRLRGALPADVLAWAGRDWRYSSDKARRELGWRPLSIRDGMAETWEEYQALGWGTHANGPVRVMRRA